MNSVTNTAKDVEVFLWIFMAKNPSEIREMIVKSLHVFSPFSIQVIDFQNRSSGQPQLEQKLPPSSS
jgi:hypothetical protein